MHIKVFYIKIFPTGKLPSNVVTLVLDYGTILSDTICYQQISAIMFSKKCVEQDRGKKSSVVINAFNPLPHNAAI